MTEARQAYLLGVIFQRADAMENAIAQALWVVSAKSIPRDAAWHVQACFEVVGSKVREGMNSTTLAMEADEEWYSSCCPCLRRGLVYSK